MSQKPSRTGLLLLFDQAVSKLQSTRVRPSLPAGIDRLICLGYPTLSPSQSVLAAASQALGVPVTAWPDTLSETAMSGLLEELTARSRAMDGGLATESKSFPWPRLKANDRVFYRMRPLARVEALISMALAAGDSEDLILPWIGERFDLVERSGMMGLDAPGHQVTATVSRLRARHDFQLHVLWPDASRKERSQVARSRVLMTAARVATIAGRALRGALRPEPCGAIPQPDAARPTVGFAVWGVSQWSSLRPLVRAAEQRYRVVLIAADIIRNPTAYKTLRDAAEPFVPVDAILGPYSTVKLMLSSLIEQRKVEQSLRQRAEETTSVLEQEQLLVPAADVASFLELKVYVEQLRSAIRTHKLAAIISANNIDSFLGATTVAAHSEGVPHVCIHNTSLESVPLPAYADCDLYVTGSRIYADYLLDHGAMGRVEPLGLPQFDELIHASQRSEGGALVAKYPHLAGKKIVGVATQTEWIDFTPILTALIDWAGRRSDVAIVIKLHPREKATAYQHFVSQLESSRLGGCLHHVPLVEFLADCDCLVGGSSTSLLWSMLMEVRPFSWVTPNIKHMSFSLEQLDAEITSQFERPIDVVNAVAFFLDDPDDRPRWLNRRRKFLDELLSGNDGQACERILNRVADLMSNPKVEPSLCSAAN